MQDSLCEISSANVEKRTSMQLVLSSERASLHQSSFTSGRLAKDRSAGAADDDCLGMREDCRYVETSGTFDIHEE